MRLQSRAEDLAGRSAGSAAARRPRAGTVDESERENGACSMQSFDELPRVDADRRQHAEHPAQTGAA